MTGGEERGEEEERKRSGEESSMEIQEREGLLQGRVKRTEQGFGRKGNSRGPWGRNKEHGCECSVETEVQV